MTVPNRSDAERRQALEKAGEARQARAVLRGEIESGRLRLATVLGRSQDQVAGRMKVSMLLESLPGFGKSKAAKIMTEFGISPSRRVQGLGHRQREQLLKRLG